MRGAGGEGGGGGQGTWEEVEGWVRVGERVKGDLGWRDVGAAYACSTFDQAFRE